MNFRSASVRISYALLHLREIPRFLSTQGARGLLGNSGKPVTLETLSLTKFSRHVFQGQGIHDFRKPGTREALNSRMCEARESGFGEEMGSRTCGSPEPRAVDGANFRGRPIREFVEDPVRESRAETCTNRWRSEGRFGNRSKTQFGNHV
jgi:hypothetical protein